jgi:glycosyltransferase involved in cell wall biosynthesis
MSFNIWYVSKYCAPPRSGTSGGRGYLLMKELGALGNKVAIITSDSMREGSPPFFNDHHFIQQLDGIVICWMRTHKYLIAKSLRRIWSWLHFEYRLLFLPKHLINKPDVIIISSLSLLTIINGLRWRKIYKCRLIFEIRDIWPLTLTAEGGYSKYNPFIIILRLIEYLGYKYSDAIVGTMPNLSEHVQSVLGYKKTVNFIPMGIDEDLLLLSKPLSEDFKVKYIPNNRFIIAYVGSIGISNALETFFECVKAVECKDNMHFLIVGDGDLLISYKKKYGNLINLTFLNRIDKLYVHSILKSCDLLYFSTHPSKVWEYGQSLNKVIDYMLSGKPIVASYTGFQSMLNESKCGTFVPANDVNALIIELNRYVQINEEERKQIGERGTKWLFENRKYTYLANNYLTIIKNLLS